MNTPDTEVEKMIIYDHHIARINRDKEGNIQSIVVDIPPVLKDLLSSRDTYWKERVRGMKWETNHVPFATEEQIRKCTCSACKHNQALTSIITRYKEELLELDKTNGL